MSNVGVSVVPAGVVDTPDRLIHDCHKSELTRYHQRDNGTKILEQKHHTHPSDNSAGEEQSERDIDIPACIFVMKHEEHELEGNISAAPRSPQQEGPQLWQRRGRFLVWPAHLGDHFDRILSESGSSTAQE